MKYWCKYCGTEIIIPVENEKGWQPIKECPLCRHIDSLTVFPAFETVAEWEKRKVEQYPDTAPVYSNTAGNWRCIGFYGGATIGAKERLIVATEAGAPPNGWRP